jgi:hypothetical protein
MSGVFAVAVGLNRASNAGVKIPDSGSGSARNGFRERVRRGCLDANSLTTPRTVPRLDCFAHPNVQLIQRARLGMAAAQLWHTGDEPAFSVSLDNDCVINGHVLSSWRLGRRLDRRLGRTALRLTSLGPEASPLAPRSQVFRLELLITLDRCRIAWGDMSPTSLPTPKHHPPLPPRSPRHDPEQHAVAEL